MKKYLAFLLAFILCFSCYAILGISTVSADTSKEPLMVSDFGGTTNWVKNPPTRVSFLDDNNDGTSDYAQLVVDETNKVTSVLSAPVNLVPGTKYELSFFVRVPEDSASYISSTVNNAPKYAIYQPTLNSEGTKVTTAHQEGINEYAYKKVRRDSFSADWKIGNYETYTISKYSIFNTKDHYSVCGAGADPKEIYKNWTKITATFTAVDDANNIGPQTVAIAFTLPKGVVGAKLDIKDVVFKEYEDTRKGPMVVETNGLKGGYITKDGLNYTVNPYYGNEFLGWYDANDILVSANATITANTSDEYYGAKFSCNNVVVESGFENYSDGALVYDRSATGKQDLYVYGSNSATLLTSFGSLTATSALAHSGTKSLKGSTYYQNVAVPVKLEPNTTYRVSFWHAYTTTDEEIYVDKIIYGFYNPNTATNKMDEADMVGRAETKKVYNSSYAPNTWKKVSYDFTTSDNVDNILFCYKYANDHETDTTNTKNAATFYIDDLVIAPVDKLPANSKITVNAKISSSVEFISGYLDDIYAGEKVEFTVNTIDGLVPEVKVDNSVLTPDANGIYSFTAAATNVIDVVCEGDENRRDAGKDKEGNDLTKYNEDIAALPIWEGDTVYHETVLFTPERETVKLLYPIKEAISVRSYDLSMNYLEGVDYEITADGLFRRLEGSRIPQYIEPLSTTKANEFPLAGKEGEYVSFIEDYVFPAYAINITYEHTEVWPEGEGYQPYAIESVKDQIPNVFEKLENGEEVNVVIFGDSASCGWSSSGLNYVNAIYTNDGVLSDNILNFAPYTPSWPVMLEAGLKKLYPDARINFKNIALGGKTSDWGVKMLKTRLGYLGENWDTDLFIFAFGGNDLTGNLSPETYGSNLQNIIDILREDTTQGGGSDTEVLMWTQYICNPEVEQYTFDKHQAYQQQVISVAKANEGVALVDTLQQTYEIYKSKPALDIFNTNVNHGNDFLTRVLAQCLIAAFAPAAEKEYIAGDIDGNGDVNLNDIVALAQIVAGWQGVEHNADALDTNGNGEVELNDVVVLAQYVAGWEDIQLSGTVYSKYNTVYRPLSEIKSKVKLNNRASFDGDLLRMEWSASGFTVQGQFSGDFVINDIEVSKETLLYAVLDGDLENAVQLRTKGKGRDLVALKDIEPGFHTVQILKASEAKASSMTFGGITYNGALFKAPAEKKLKIEFIGDSISSAMGLYTETVEPDWLLRTDITKGYAIKVADYFNAEFNIVSCSNGSICTESPYMYDEYQNLYCGNTDIKYDFTSRDEPDLVVIALGANDTPAYITKDENGKTVTADNIDVLKQGIIDMLTMVRKHNPNATILWVYGMMELRVASVFQNTVNEFAQTDGNTQYMIVNRNDCNGAGGHPTPAGHAANAQEIITYIDANIF